MFGHQQLNREHSHAVTSELQIGALSPAPRFKPYLRLLLAESRARCTFFKDKYRSGTTGLVFTTMLICDYQLRNRYIEKNLVISYTKSSNNSIFLTAVYLDTVYFATSVVQDMRPAGLTFPLKSVWSFSFQQTKVNTTNFTALQFKKMQRQ